MNIFIYHYSSMVTADFELNSLPGTSLFWIVRFFLRRHISLRILAKNSDSVSIRLNACNMNNTNK